MCDWGICSEAPQPSVRRPTVIATSGNACLSCYKFSRLHGSKGGKGTVGSRFANVIYAGEHKRSLVFCAKADALIVATEKDSKLSLHFSGKNGEKYDKQGLSGD